jgi:protein TonB
MRILRILGVISALLLHVGFLAFGGILFAGPEHGAGSVREVELLSSVEEEEKREEEQQDAETREANEDLAQEEEAPPDAAEIIRSLELTPLVAAPALDTVSLSAIEAALSGNLGVGGDFFQSADLSSGGRIGGTGQAGLSGEALDQAFSLAEVDQQARAVYQVSPNYPADLRGKKIEGLVTLIFTVDADGKIQDPRVEKSNHPSFERPALEALRKWKFEPALRNGKRAACRMRQPIRFPAS